MLAYTSIYYSRFPVTSLSSQPHTDSRKRAAHTEHVEGPGLWAGPGYNTKCKLQKPLRSASEFAFSIIKHRLGWDLNGTKVVVPYEASGEISVEVQPEQIKTDLNERKRVRKNIQKAQGFLAFTPLRSPSTETSTDFYTPTSHNRGPQK